MFFAAVGILVLVYRRAVAQAIFDRQRPGFETMFGSTIKRKNALIERFNRWLVTFFGIMFLVGAAALLLHPIVF